MALEKLFPNELGNQNARKKINELVDSVRQMLAGGTSAFGETLTATKTPQAQLKFNQGLLNPEIGQPLTNNASSTVTVTAGYAKVTCAGTANSFSQIRTLDTVRYGPGQGAEFEGTCAFVTGGVATSSQVFGCGDDDEGFFFGYNGTSFGILHRHSGSLAIKSLVITAGASGSGNITITLDGSDVVIAVTAGDTIEQVVEKIGAEGVAFGNAGRGWEVHNDDDNGIEFISFVAENAAGAFTFTDTDTTGVTANAFDEHVAGVAPTETWVAQSDWSEDKMDGSGTSRMTINTSNLNVYRIYFQYLGSGGIVFQVEDTATTKWQDVHIIKYSGTAQIPSLNDPTLHLTLIAKTETGYSGSALEMRTGSMAGFIQGEETTLGVRKGISATTSGIGTTLNHVITFHNEIDFNGLKNKVSVYPDLFTVSTEGGSKSVEIKLLKGPDRIDGGVAFTDVDAGVSVMQWHSTGSAVSGGEVVLPLVLGGADSDKIILRDMGFKLRPGDRWTVAAKTTGGTSVNVTAGLSWIERE